MEANLLAKKLPNAPVTLNLEAYINILKGNFKVAEKKLKKSLKIDSKNYKTLYAMARLFIVKKEWNNALEMLHKISKPNGALNFNVLRTIVQVYSKIGNLGKALEVVSDFSGKNPKNYDVKVFLAEVLYKNKNEKQAIKVLREAKTLEPERIKASVMLSSIFALKKDYEKSEREFLDILEKRPNYVPALLQLGRIGEMRKDTEKAIKFYKKTLAVEPDNTVALNNYAWILAEKGTDLDKALNYAQTAKSKEPKSLPITDTLGWIYLKKNMYALAITNFEQCVRKLPSHPIYNFHLGLAYYKQGKVFKAKAHLKKAIKLKKDFNGVEEAVKIINSIKG